MDKNVNGRFRPEKERTKPALGGDGRELFDPAPLGCL